MGRPRKGKNASLPPNLYAGSNGHYKYRRPDNGKWHSMGLDKNKAVSAAKQLNSMLMRGRELVEHVIKNSSILNDFLEEFENNILKTEKNLSKETLRNYKNKLKHIREQLGSKPIDEISVLEISSFLKQYPVANSNRYRSLLMVIFKYAMANGLCESNPAEKTIPRKEEKTRKRLTLDGYMAIYTDPETELWFKNAMNLALQTLQRREDIVKMQFSDIREDHLYVIQTKTEKHGEAAFLKIQIDPPLQKVINRCRDSVASPYLVHRIPDKLTSLIKNSPLKNHYTQLTPDYLTKAFARIRDKLTMFKEMPRKERPTFHEIRSLGIKLYEDQGIDAQTLAGHTTREMTDNYKKGHEIQWTDTTAGLEIKHEALKQL